MDIAIKILNQYSDFDSENFDRQTDILRIEDVESAMKQYAKEAIQEVVSQYNFQKIKTLREGGEFPSLDYVALEVIKQLK